MKMIGACGDDCGECPRYRATMSGNETELTRVRDLWVSLGWRKPETDPEELKCRGCTADNKCAYTELRDCTFGKGLTNCGRCRNFPCEIANRAFERTADLFASLNPSCSKENRLSLERAFNRKKFNLEMGM